MRVFAYNILYMYLYTYIIYLSTLIFCKSNVILTIMCCKHVNSVCEERFVAILQSGTSEVGIFSS